MNVSRFAERCGLRALKAPIAAMLLAAGPLAGCATVYDLTKHSTADNVYGGVRLDGHIIASAATGGGGNCGLDNCDKYAVWSLGLPAVIDLPLSLVGDTLALPYTLTRTPQPAPAPPDRAGDQ